MLDGIVVADKLHRGERCRWHPAMVLMTAARRERAIANNARALRDPILRRFAPDIGQEWKRSGSQVAEPSLEEWKHQDRKVVARYYAQTESDFFEIIDEYVEQANVHTRQYQRCEKSNARWRFGMIMATGGLAVVNVMAALDLAKLWHLSMFAAVYAACLTAAGNAESFFNSRERALGFREARDQLLDRYLEFRSKWIYSVEAHGKTPKACMNAGRLYGQLVDSDQKLRQRLKKLTESRLLKQSGKSAGAH
jgi:hypothetical protein